MHVLKLDFGHGELQSIPSLAPPAETPICWNADGTVRSRFGDDIWLLPGKRIGAVRAMDWIGSAGTDAAARKSIHAGKQILLLRLSHGSAVAAGTLAGYRAALSALLAHCREAGISLDRLGRHPIVLAEFAGASPANYVASTATMARTALAHRKDLGWTWLDADQVKSLRQRGVTHRQHPVVPRSVLDRVDAVADAIIEGYLSVSNDFAAATKQWLSHSKKSRLAGKAGYWPSIVESHPKLKKELDLWNVDLSPQPSRQRIAYITLVRQAAFYRIARGSWARRDEVLNLRLGSMRAETVEGVPVPLLVGPTTKTQTNKNAVWVVAPYVEPAVTALERILEWSLACNKSDPGGHKYLFEILDLTLGQYLPPSQRRIGKKLVSQPMGNIELNHLLARCDTTISGEDFAQALMLTPSLNRKKYEPNKRWRVSPHQLRRTGIVHAAASGLVSLDSLSFQAKHQTIQMTAYYARNYWKLAASDPDSEIVRGTDPNLAESVAKEYADSYNSDRETIASDQRFFSVYGADHKARTMASIPLLSLQEIKRGEAAEVLKRNTLGICAQAEHCEWQSAHSVRGCMTKSDGNPCVKAIVDSDRIDELEGLIESLTYRLEELRARDEFERQQVLADIDAAKAAIRLIMENQNAN